MKIQNLSDMDVVHDKVCAKLEKHPEILKTRPKTSFGKEMTLFRFERIPSLYAWWECSEGYKWSIVSTPIRVTGIKEDLE